MRVFLTLDQQSRNGFVAVNPSRGNLDGVVEAGEASEVVALDVLDYFKLDQQQDLLRHWASRLAPGGVLTVSCTDIYEVARSLALGFADEGWASQMLYGAPEARKAVQFSEKSLSHILASMGLQAISRRVEGYQCIVVMGRPL